MASVVGKDKPLAWLHGEVRTRPFSEAARIEVGFFLRELQRGRLLVHSSQSRVAKMEGGDPSVSLDLLIRSLLALGASTRDLARAISGPPLAKAS